MYVYVLYMGCLFVRVRVRTCTYIQLYIIPPEGVRSWCQYKPPFCLDAYRFLMTVGSAMHKIFCTQYIHVSRHKFIPPFI